MRVRLDVPEQRDRFPQLADLLLDGATDYLAEPLFFHDGRVSCGTVATRRRGGFEEAELAFFKQMLPMVALRLDAHSQRHALASLLTAYLGRNAAARVLAGEFRRGGGETLRAVLWFSDMRDFTTLGERLAPRALVGLLDRFFECIADAIDAHGGEVLKLVGDGALAVFPVEGDDATDACRRATACARDVLARLRALSRQLEAEGRTATRVGIGLHLGEVIYGNIGSRTRLDFTVIGPAVNTVSRIEGMTKALGVPVLASGDFSRWSAPGEFESRGSHELRGVETPFELFALRSPDDEG